MKLIGYFARGLRSGFKRRRAKSLYEKGELDLAIALYADAISMNPDCAESHFGSGLAHLRKGKIDQAIADFTNAIRLNPGDDVAYYNRGFALLAKESLTMPSQTLKPRCESIRITRIPRKS